MQSSNEKELKEAEPLTWRFWRKKRYIVVLLAFFGCLNLYSMRNQISVAIVAMTENRTFTDVDGIEQTKPLFNYNSKEKSVILSSFYYGYIATQILGGIVSAKYGGNYLFGIGVGVPAILSIATPIVAKHGFYYLIALRIIVGLFEGLTFPCLNAVFSRWAPPAERARMSSVSLSGTYFGTVIVNLCSGFIATYLGWESIFHIFGGIALLWSIIWLIVVRAGPELDKCCSKDEIEYIQASLGTKNRPKNLKHPWKKIFTSKPLYAIMAAHFATTWGLYTAMTTYPIYLTDVFDYKLDKTGIISSFPYVLKAFVLLFAGCLADFLVEKGKTTKNRIRKYFVSLSLLVQAIFILITAFVVHRIWSLASYTAAVACGGFALSGYGVNHLDIGGQHASVLFGIDNTVSAIPGILSPLIYGFVAQNKSPDEWRIVYCIGAGVFSIGAIMYAVFGSADLQEWAKTDDKEEPSVIKTK